MSSVDGWEPVQRLRTYEQVMAQIEERILSGQLKAGDHLPSERDLAVLLGVSRPSLRESLRVLEALGILEVRRGGGPDGGAILVGQPGDGFVNLLKLPLALGHYTHTDLLETRIALETWSCSEAAIRSQRADHAELAAILERMEEDGIETSRFNALDAEFHVRIAESTGNTLTSQLMGSLRVAINRQMVEAYAGLSNWRATAAVVSSEHRAILDAIARGESEVASRLVKEHIESFYRIGQVGGSPPER